jgi:signal transduction histidine kinase
LNAILGSVLLYVTIFTNGIVKDVIFVDAQEKNIIFGNIYFYFYPLFVAGLFIWSYIILLRKKRNLQGKMEAQTSIVFWGTFLASSCAMITNLLLPSFGFFYFNWAGQILSLFMVGFIAYAVIVHRLMDIRLVLRKSSVYLTSLLTIVLIALAAQYYLSRTFFEYKQVINLILLIFSLSVFSVIKSYYYQFANKYFFSSLYDSRKVIAELSERLRSTLDIVRIYAVINELLINTFHAKSVGILTYDSRLKKYKTQSHSGDPIDGSILKAAKDFNEAYLINNIPMIIEEVREEKIRNSQSTEGVDILLEHNIEMVLPLSVKNKNIGLIMVGAKESRDMFNDEDLQVLEIIGAQAAIAIENALLYKETKDFNVKLKKEIDSATAELRLANDELTRLDETKSEFISIASHQLRTPLTIIKGYVSMMLENNFGEMSVTQISALDKVYESNERLIRLVENLLNISRIESGRIQYRPEQIHLDAIVEAVYNELHGIASKRGLSFDYAPPKKELPMVWADPDKVKEIIMNLTDNSIKYTKKGSIKCLWAR